MWFRRRRETDTYCLPKSPFYFHHRWSLEKDLWLSSKSILYLRISLEDMEFQHRIKLSLDFENLYTFSLACGEHSGPVRLWFGIEYVLCFDINSIYVSFLVLQARCLSFSFFFFFLSYLSLGDASRHGLFTHLFRIFLVFITFLIVVFCFTFVNSNVQ